MTVLFHVIEDPVSPLTVAEGIPLAICIVVFIYLGAATFLPERF